MIKKINWLEVQIFLEKVLIHPLPQIRRELLDYLLRLRKSATRSFGVTVQVNGAIQVLELTPEEWQGVLVKVLDAFPTPPTQPHSQLVQDLQSYRCTLLRASLVLGISKTKAQRYRKGVKPSKHAVAPVTEIFRALLEGRRKKEIAYKVGVTAQTVSNVRSRVLDLLLYEVVQQFMSGSKVA